MSREDRLSGFRADSPWGRCLFWGDLLHCLGYFISDSRGVANLANIECRYNCYILLGFLLGICLAGMDLEKFGEIVFLFLPCILYNLARAVTSVLAFTSLRDLEHTRPFVGLPIYFMYNLWLGDSFVVGTIFISFQSQCILLLKKLQITSAVLRTEEYPHALLQPNPTSCQRLSP